MTDLTSIRIGGVPEHFNFPWHEARRNGWFAEAGVQLDWRDYPEGTGAMAADLDQDRLDAAIVLSEGAVAAISRGVPIRMLGWAVASPLVWGIHVPSHAPVRSLGEVAGRRFAISRYGSGSHLMAHVLADRENWPQPEFEVVDHLDGAIRAFAAGQADLFLWERFTTQPVVDAGAMRRIDEIPTPWPAFVLVATERALTQSGQAIGSMWRVACRAFGAIRGLDDLAARIAADHGLEIHQVSQWLQLTHWGDGSPIAPPEVAAIIRRLDGLGLLARPLQPADCLRTTAQ